MTALEAEGQKDLVLLDDDKLTIEIVSWILRKTHFSYELFSDPDRALDYLSRQPPHRLIVDFYMPGINGLEFLQKLSNQICLDSTKLFICSSVILDPANESLMKELDVQLIEKEVVCDAAQFKQLLGLEEARCTDVQDEITSLDRRSA